MINRFKTREVMCAVVELIKVMPNEQVKKRRDIGSFDAH